MGLAAMRGSTPIQPKRDAMTHPTTEAAQVRKTEHFFCRGWKIVKNTETSRWTFRKFNSELGAWETAFHSIHKDEIAAFVRLNYLEKMLPWKDARSN
jgi:hypothetical protein